MTSELVVLVGLVAGNFMFQGMKVAPDWSEATERSFFQAIAVAAVLWAARVG